MQSTIDADVLSLVTSASVVLKFNQLVVVSKPHLMKTGPYCFELSC